MSEIVEIGPWRLLSAYFFLLLLLSFIKGQSIGKEKEILVSALRMTVQLILMGYVLVYIFAQNCLSVTLLVFFIMVFFAIRNIFGRVKVPVKKRLRRVIMLSMVAGTSLTIFYFFAAGDPHRTLV